VRTRWPLVLLALASVGVGLGVGYAKWTKSSTRGPTPSTAEYLRAADRICLWRNGEEDKLAAAGKLVPARLIGLSRSETAAISRIEPPQDYGIRYRILLLKTTVDTDAMRLWEEADRARPKFKRFWNGVATPRLNRETIRMQIKLQRMGLPDCSNYGPAPAPSLLPKP
jgi:hypothetical protein